MNIHKNSGLTPRGRGILILRLERGEHPQDVATAMCISVRTVYKWRRRYRAEGIAGLQDRSSRRHTSPDKTPDDVETTVITLRKERRIYHRTAAETGLSESTVGRILTRHGLNRWRDLEPAEPPRQRRLDPYGEDILRWIKETPDLTLQELSQRLHERHEVVAPISTIDDWLRSRKISFKKNRTRQ